VKEQLMATDAKSKAAANFLRFRFIDVFPLVLVFRLLHSGDGSFSQPHKVFLLGKAETAVETRQVFYRVGVGQGGIPPALSKGRRKARVRARSYRPSPGSDAD
jgi:hypothetical protein